MAGFTGALTSLFPASAVPCYTAGPTKAKQILHRQANNREDGKLRLEIQEAIITYASYRRSEQPRMLLEKGDVVQHEIGVHELETHDLVQEMHFMISLRSMVLAICEKLGHGAQQVVDYLHEAGK
jgi:hypothetical protein